MSSNVMADLSNVALTGAFVLLGSFYAFAGMVAGRAALMDAVLDAALTGISGTHRNKLDVERSAWLLGCACVVGGGGILLGIGSSLALPVFLVSCGLQIAHFLYLSPKRFDVEEPVSQLGRRQSLNAFSVYVVVTAFVAWATLSGHLAPVSDTHLGLFYVLGIVWLGVSIWSFYWLLTLERSIKKRKFEDDLSEDDTDSFYDDDERAAQQEWAKTAQIILAPCSHFYPLFDALTRKNLDAGKFAALGLPDDVRDALIALGEQWLEIIDPDDPRQQLVLDPNQALNLQASGLRLFEQLEAHLGDRVTIQSDVWPNVPQIWPPELHVAASPHTTCVFDNWPDPDNFYGIVLDHICISINLRRDLNFWAYHAADFCTQDAHLADASLPEPIDLDALALHVIQGRTIAQRLHCEFTKTGRADTRIFYHPENGPKEEFFS
jgi:hypothetical protein